ncbi:hypothetical protein, partial [Novosphingobium sp. Leaf2]|uniref:hypothetical protein n=1 Tax=Novosphingobium sp. Leaf2 TaxID=1735670 RepID=UPI000AC247BC
PSEPLLSVALACFILNIGMLAPIRLTNCPGLIDLMLTAEEHSEPSFVLNGVQCAVSQIGGGHALLEAVTSDFGLMVVYPGWYTGDHGEPAHIAIVGEAHACMRWLPIEQSDKHRIILHLHISETDKMLCHLSS